VRTRWPISRGWGDDGLLHESQEEQALAAEVAAIGAEGKFIEVGVQRLRRDRPLMGAQQPALEQGSDPIHRRH
jgi:hypothetical protein